MGLMIESLGDIKPITYRENLTFNSMNIELIPMPNCVDEELTALVLSLINNTHIYNPVLCNLTNISMAKNDKSIYMALLNHIYYGIIKLWLALPSYLPSPLNKILFVEYIDNNLYASIDKSILK